MAVSKIAIGAGHCASAPGASGNGYKEHEVARKIKDFFIKDGRAAGLTITDCTYDGSGSSNTELSNKVSKANSSGAQLFIDIHYNANSGTPGTGVEVYSWNADKTYAKPVCDALASTFGLTNRGVKSGNGLYVINSTSMAAILIEVAFINNSSDMAKVGGKEQKIADTILTALTGKAINTTPKADGWYKESGLWYYYKGGSKLTGWQKLKWSKGEDWFYLGTSGAMVEGWFKWDGSWFYCVPGDGNMLEGWHKVKDSHGTFWRYFKENGSGRCLEGIATINGKTYYLTPDIGNPAYLCEKLSADFDPTKKEV
jgi:N-acetylmuramoyl-L-alanine amidase